MLCGNEMYFFFLINYVRLKGLFDGEGNRGFFGMDVSGSVKLQGC